MNINQEIISETREVMKVSVYIGIGIIDRNQLSFNLLSTKKLHIIVKFVF